MFLRNYKFRLKELELELEFKKQELDAKLLLYEKTIQDQMHKLAEKCAEDTANYEHDYHSGIQKKMSKLAELDAQILARTETAANDKVTYERIIKIKDDTITSLNTSIENLVETIGRMQGYNKTINK
jgi:hypothetical protein